MKWLFFLLAGLYGHLPFAHALEPYSGSRIFWDTASRRTVFSGGGYARIIELQDGRLMAVCESGGIKIAFSQDKCRPTSPAPASCKAAATTRRSDAHST